MRNITIQAISGVLVSVCIMTSWGVHAASVWVVDTT